MVDLLFPGDGRLTIWNPLLLVALRDCTGVGTAQDVLDDDADNVSWPDGLCVANPEPDLCPEANP